MAKRRDKVPIEERKQVQARKKVNHDFGLTKDERGRDRLVKGTAHAEVEYEHDDNSTVVRARHADHLYTMWREKRITRQQFVTGEMYQADYVLVHAYGIGGGGWAERVDNSGATQPDMPLHVAAANQRLEQCAEKAGVMGEYVLREVCGRNNSPSSLKGVGGAPREYWTARLREALEEIAVHVYRTMKPRDRAMAPFIPPTKQT